MTRKKYEFFTQTGRSNFVGPGERWAVHVNKSCSVLAGRIAVDSTFMDIDSIKQKMKIVGVEEARRLSPAELAGWNILSIRGRLNKPLDFPGALKSKSLHFDDVQEDCPEDGEFAARLEDIQDALAFSRAIGDEPLLIHCVAGISRSTAIAWIIIYDKLKEKPDAIRQSFEIVRKLRPILLPNRHVLKLGVEALAPPESRKEIMRQFHECLVELNPEEPATPT